jgi:hypothetical protein
MLTLAVWRYYLIHEFTNMSDAPDVRHEELIAWLTERGHNPDEIAKILAKVAEYDAQTIKESIFDSIDSGDFDLSALINEALGNEEK